MAISPEFAQVLAHLKDAGQTLPALDLYALSNLGQQEIEALEEAWPGVLAERRVNLLHDLAEVGEANHEVNFDAVFRLALEDETAEARTTAIKGLWEAEDAALIAPFLEILQRDADVTTRAAAASALGRYVYLGEVEEISAKHLKRVEDALLATINGTDDLEVRRRALEAIAFSSRPEVPPLLEAAYASEHRLMKISAIFAMGRSANDQWNDFVIEELDSDDPELRFEAVRAVGELELPSGVPTLIELADDDDVQVREAAIWSLGQVGGEQARAKLLDLIEEAEDDERDFIEEALENLTFHDDMVNFSLLDVSEDDDDLDFLDDDDDPVPPVQDRLN
jgi:HEAT repeat protein